MTSSSFRSFKLVVKSSLRSASFSFSSLLHSFALLFEQETVILSSFIGVSVSAATSCLTGFNFSSSLFTVSSTTSLTISLSYFSSFSSSSSLDVDFETDFVGIGLSKFMLDRMLKLAIGLWGIGGGVDDDEGVECEFKSGLSPDANCVEAPFLQLISSVIIEISFISWLKASSTWFFSIFCLKFSFFP